MYLFIYSQVPAIISEVEHNVRPGKTNFIFLTVLSEDRVNIIIGITSTAAWIMNPF